VASVAVISLKLWIRANARDGLNQLHWLAAAEACGWVPGFVFGLFSGSHAAKVRLKSIALQYGCVSHHQKEQLPLSFYFYGLFILSALCQRATSHAWFEMKKEQIEVAN
jgi:hypothetical protein